MTNERLQQLREKALSIGCDLSPPDGLTADECKELFDHIDSLNRQINSSFAEYYGED